MNSDSRRRESNGRACLIIVIRDQRRQQISSAISPHFEKRFEQQSGEAATGTRIEAV
jgi:hypothetical protein